MNRTEVLKKLKLLREKFDTKKHCYEIHLKFFYPPTRFYTKTGEISSKTMDITNVEKCLVDLIFQPKYFGKTHPEGADNLNIDDKWLTKMVSEKVAHTEDNYKIEVVIKINNLV